MYFKLITEQDLDCIIKIQHEIFPKYSAKINYIESISGITNNEYYIVYLNNIPIGITGIYTYPIDPESAWLGWFGIREPYRCKGYGSKVIQHFEYLAKTRGFKYVRLYTDKNNNFTAINFYKANGYTYEDYNNENDYLAKKYPTIIFSKSLGDYPLVRWNNRNINLTDQLKKELNEIKEVKNNE